MKPSSLINKVSSDQLVLSIAYMQNNHRATTPCHPRRLPNCNKRRLVGWRTALTIGWGSQRRPR